MFIMHSILVRKELKSWHEYEESVDFLSFLRSLNLWNSDHWWLESRPLNAIRYSFVPMQNSILLSCMTIIHYNQHIVTRPFLCAMDIYYSNVLQLDPSGWECTYWQRQVLSWVVCKCDRMNVLSGSYGVMDVCIIRGDRADLRRSRRWRL